MKKLLIILVSVIVTVPVFAEVEKGIRNGIQVQAGMTNVLGEGDSFSVGYGASWLIEYNFSSRFYVQSGLGIENISHKEDAVDGTLNAFYGVLPIHAGYRLPLGDNSALFIQAGPSVACGLFGSKIEWYGGGESNYFDLIERFDVFVGGRIGVEFSKFQISVGANYGVLEAADGYNNFTANIGIAYMF